MLYSDKYSEIAPRFANWLEVNNLGNASIPNLTLDYVNRAISSLALEPTLGWDYLSKEHVQLTLSGDSGLECALPSDCGVLLLVYTDPTGTHKPTIYYTKDGKVPTGFRWMGAYAPGTGFDGTKIKFYYAPIAVPYCKYQIVLPALTGTGTEYLPFPGELIILEAQRIRCREKGLVNEWKIMQPEYEAFLKKFKNQHQNCDEDATIELLDYQGVPILLPEYGLATGTRQRQIWGRRNDMDYIMR